MILSLLDIQDDTKPMNSSHENIGGLAYKQIFDDTSMDAKSANVLEFIETNLTHHYTLMKYPLNLGSIFQSTSSDPYLNPQDIMQYWSLLTDFPRCFSLPQ